MNTRLTNTKHASLNESIAYVNSPQRELDEAREYALALEEVLLALCEELDIDPHALLEDLQTPARKREMDKQIERQEARVDRAGMPPSPFSRGKGANRQRMSRDREIAKANTLWNRREREELSKKTYGRGGKVVKPKK